MNVTIDDLVTILETIDDQTIVMSDGLDEILDLKSHLHETQNPS